MNTGKAAGMIHDEVKPFSSRPTLPRNLVNSTKSENKTKTLRNKVWNSECPGSAHSFSGSNNHDAVKTPSALTSCLSFSRKVAYNLHYGGKPNCLSHSNS